MRTPFQGTRNMVRFNWHFFAIAAACLALGLALAAFLPAPLRAVLYGLCALALVAILIPLLVTYYAYDLSELYCLPWRKRLKPGPVRRIVNINAGLDETSGIIRSAYPDAELLMFDFYDPERHTEPSIERARRLYPSPPETRRVRTAELPLTGGSVDLFCLIQAAHEIRDEDERVAFFTELARALREGGQIVVTEHLRNLPNIFGYSLGVFHFYSRSTWLRTFDAAGLRVLDESGSTPFITTFVLGKALTSPGSS